MAFHVGFLVFPEVQQLDLTGPFDVLAAAPEIRCDLLWKTTEPVRASSGLILTPSLRFEACGQLDMLCIPGGGGVNALLQDPAVLAFVRAQAAGARYVTSVCTGALLLGAAGLLAGRRATTHWMAHDLLAAFGAIPTQGRVVRDGALITAGGVTAGIDFGLTVLAELLGQARAEQVQLGLEYAPAPPFSAGTPETAPPAVLAAARARGAASRQAREAIIAAITAG